MDFAPFARYPEHRLTFEPRAVRREELLELERDEHVWANVDSLRRKLIQEASQKLFLPPEGWHWEGEIQTSEDLAADAFQMRVVYRLKPIRNFGVTP